MPSFSPLWPDGPLFAPARHAPLSTDSVLLADFVRLSGVRRGIDLGCGSGILALLLLSRSQRLEMTGLELLGFVLYGEKVRQARYYSRKHYGGYQSYDKYDPRNQYSTSFRNVRTRE